MIVNRYDESAKGLGMMVRSIEFRDVQSRRRECGGMEEVEDVDVEGISKGKEAPNTSRKVS